MLEAETETNEEEATEETYHDDKRSRVAVKNINLLFFFIILEQNIYFSDFFFQDYKMPRRKTTRRRRLDKVMDYNPGNLLRGIDNKTIEDREFQYVIQ